MPVNKRFHAFYSGSVQGIGFRFTAERLASSLGIKGWVSNLSDGRVELVCEGKGPALDEFLKKISDVFGAYMREADIRPEEVTGEFQDFDIRFG